MLDITVVFTNVLISEIFCWRRRCLVQHREEGGEEGGQRLTSIGRERLQVMSLGRIAGYRRAWHGRYFQHSEM